MDEEEAMLAIPVFRARVAPVLDWCSKIILIPEEAADAVFAFHPKIVIPYHYGTSDPKMFQQKLEGSGIEVRLLNWYANKKG
jgi:L-ascorbate metabolism protein UlaG (beta-lactamase superfamily)